MNLDIIKPDSIFKNEIEQVEEKKKEYLILGTYVLNKGYKLFSFNPTNEEIKEIIINKSNTIQIANTFEKGWIMFDPETMKAQIDSKNYYFESLNISTAKNWIIKCRKYNKEICNLKLYNSDGIEFLKNLF
jgi:SUMO ligase MMS21 Smc5/6 complex component